MSTCRRPTFCRSAAPLAGLLSLASLSLVGPSASAAPSQPSRAGAQPGALGAGLLQRVAMALQVRFPAGALPHASPLLSFLSGGLLGKDRDAGPRGASLGDAALRTLGSGLRALMEPESRAEAELANGPDGRARYQLPLDGGTRAELTLDPRLQRHTDQVLAGHKRAYAAAVVLDVHDGRVLALSGRSEAEPERTAADLCLTPWAPAASIFKLVTAAALVSSGVSPEARVCYHGGVQSVEASNLVSTRKDRSCNNLAFGVAKSQNAILARLAADHLDPETLARTARALGFGESLPVDLPVVPSEAAIPKDPLDFARVAAGFWQTSLSPLHGAWLAATIARGGTTPPLHFLRPAGAGAEGGASTASSPASAPIRRVLDERTARTVGQMMIGTTRFGTAKLAFHDRRGRPYLRRVDVAGKTGTLARKEGKYLGYSWFVGYAPADDPQVAFAVLLANSDDWSVKAAQMAREILQGWFQAPTTPARTLLAAR